MKKRGGHKRGAGRNAGDRRRTGKGSVPGVGKRAEAAGAGEPRRSRAATSRVHRSVRASRRARSGRGTARRMDFARPRRASRVRSKAATSHAHRSGRASRKARSARGIPSRAVSSRASRPPPRGARRVRRSQAANRNGCRARMKNRARRWGRAGAATRRSRRRTGRRAGSTPAGRAISTRASLRSMRASRASSIPARHGIAHRSRHDRGATRHRHQSLRRSPSRLRCPRSRPACRP